MSAVIQALGEIADKKFKKEEAERKASRAISSDLARQEGYSSYAAYLWKEYQGPLSKIGTVLMFYLIGILFYHYNMGWNINDCIYFITVSVTTVGYGDFSPDNDGGRLFTIIFVLLGIAFIFAIINDFATSFIRSVEAKALEKLDDDPTDDKAPHGWKIAISIMTILLVVFLGAIFFMINEDWSFVKALYWCFITSMTVGYGDLSLKYESSRTFSIFYILITVIVVAAAIGNLGAIQAEIAAEKKKIELLNRKLDLQMILDMDQGGDGVDRVEFLTAMLVANNGLDKAKDIDPWMQRFTELDKDGSGMLDKDDLRLFAEEEERKTAQLKERLTRHIQGPTMSPFQTSDASIMAPHGWKIAIAIMTILLVVFLGAIFFMINEDWSFVVKALYWCFITSMTVGYGDLSLKYESSRTFSIFYILITMIVVAAAIGNFGAIQAEIAAEKKKIELLNRILMEME